jgi:cytochrome c-type biogenesis protein CcmH/NrfG
VGTWDNPETINVRLPLPELLDVECLSPQVSRNRLERHTMHTEQRTPMCKSVRSIKRQLTRETGDWLRALQRVSIPDGEAAVTHSYLTTDPSLDFHQERDCPQVHPNWQAGNFIRFLLPDRYHRRTIPIMRSSEVYRIAVLVMVSVNLIVYGNKAAGISQEGPTEAGLEEEFRQAREKLRSAPEFQRNDALTHMRFAEALHHRGDLTGAIQEYRAAISAKPDLSEAYRGLGVVFMDRHDWPRAAEALAIATDQHPDDAEAFYWLGRALMAHGDWSGAGTALTRAADLNPEDAEAYADLGLVRMAQGDLPAAAEALRHAVDLKPDNADTHNLLETVLAHQHDQEHVSKAARRMLDTMFARE